MNEENETIHVFDIISLQPQNIEEVVAHIVNETTEKVIFYFTPDTSIDGLHVVMAPNDEDALFIYTKKNG